MDLAFGGSIRTNAQQVQLVTQLADTARALLVGAMLLLARRVSVCARRLPPFVRQAGTLTHILPGCEAVNPVCCVLLARHLVPVLMRTCLLSVKVTAVDWQAQKGRWRTPKARVQQLCM